MRALFAGSFDPVTFGHLDLISRVVPLVESMVVAVAVNSEKRPIFSEEERLTLLRTSCQTWPQVEVRAFQGLVVDAARAVGATVIIRGIRNASELDHELQMAHTNRRLSGIETLLLPASPQWSFVSSSLIKEVARYGGDITPYVPAAVAARVLAHFRER